MHGCGGKNSLPDPAAPPGISGLHVVLPVLLLKTLPADDIVVTATKGEARIGVVAVAFTCIRSRVPPAANGTPPAGGVIVIVPFRLSVQVMPATTGESQFTNVKVFAGPMEFIVRVRGPVSFPGTGTLPGFVLAPFSEITAHVIKSPV
jgi:hypothetical protein